MKKAFAISLALFMLMSVAVVPASAVGYENPFAAGTLGSETYRIPALYTLNDGSVIAVADMRYGHGSDAPNNIEIVAAISPDGYSGWEYSYINYFDDYADGVTDANSASFIDSAVVQSSTGRIFIVSDAFPSGGGYNQALKGTGFITVDGKKCMLLTSGDNTAGLDSFGYYMGVVENGFAKVYKRDGSATAYSVDAEYNLYKNGAPLYMKQNGSSRQVKQNVYYSGAELSCYRTAYLWMRYSDDGGKTWSAPVNLSAQIKKDNEKFLGIGPGRGIATMVNGKERIIFCVYDNAGSGIDVYSAENVSTIYSDDNGVTWHRGEETSCRALLTKTSEAQIVEMGNGRLRMYARNNYNYVSYADSKDGGKSWTKFKSDTVLSANGNCMSTFINTDAEIYGEKVILGAFASNITERADGVIKTGVIDKHNGEVKWIQSYDINDGFYAYSCMTELADGNYAILYEDGPAKISYKILNMNEKGALTEINGDNVTSVSTSFFEKFSRFFYNIFDVIFEVFGML